MNQLLTPQEQNSSPVLCYYVNWTQQLQVVRIANISDCYWERVVFPGQRIMFTASIEAELEVYASSPPTAMLSDKLSVKTLQVETYKEKGE
ncbi:DUF1830 domain-containing protein [Calothrix sp. 336/3]|uniref:DUF1830 domain-containing protein n=1 Tax=Calothrix sp. 336/3 TaxID=1337936 RepID=UPI00054F57ED|nr:DUF1830 domain-containing protein [Calothrix sp. 336/3]AKG23647.1 hypothetical protein IJ00_22270 [Calothrix sp. 336/3]